MSTLRERFEVWARSNGHDCEWLNGRYPSIRTSGAWDGFQAAYKLALEDAIDKSRTGGQSGRTIVARIRALRDRLQP